MKNAVKNYKTGERIGEIELTESQFSDYLALAHQPQGTLRLGDPAAFPYYELDAEYQHLSSDTIFYLD